MDTRRIGLFLAQLRKAQGLNQEELGEKLGVTNKTVSRWETGTYLPGADMLLRLSVLYGITINEILSGQRLEADAFREKAEENLQAVLRKSPFTLEERVEYFKAKWRREHFTGGLICRILLWGLLLMGITSGVIWWNVAFVLGNLVYGVWERNRMMIYVESHAYDGTGSQ